MGHKKQINTRIAAGFLTRSFRLDETIAIVLRRVSPSTIAQRIVTLQRALQSRYLAGFHMKTRAGRTSMSPPIHWLLEAGSGTRKVLPKFAICISIWTRREKRNLQLSGP
jgi:hypothetical protein